jgi:hypothetical protein
MDEVRPVKATDDALLAHSCTQVLPNSRVHTANGVGAKEHVVAGGGGRTLEEGDDFVGPVVVHMGSLLPSTCSIRTSSSRDKIVC